MSEPLTVLRGLTEAVIAMKQAIPAAETLGEQWRPFLRRTGDVNVWLDKAEATLDAARQNPNETLESRQPTVDVEDDWRWECSSCDRPVTPKGMCETCGTFGVLRLTESIARAYAEVDWPTLANVIREVDGNHDLGAGELAERILAHPAMRAARQPTVDVEALASALRSAAERVHGNESHLRASFADCYQWPCTRYRAVLYFADHYGTGLAAQETPERLGSDE